MVYITKPEYPHFFPAVQTQVNVGVQLDIMFLPVAFLDTNVHGVHHGPVPLDEIFQRCSIDPIIELFICIA